MLLFLKLGIKFYSYFDFEFEILGLEIFLQTDIDWKLFLNKGYPNAIVINLHFKNLAQIVSLKKWRLYH